MPYRRRTPYPTSVIGPNRLSDGPIATAPCQVPDREQLILHIVEDKRLMESGNGQTVTGHHDRARMNRIFGPATDEAKKAISGIAQLARMKRAVPLQHLDRFKVALRRLPRFEGMAHQISVPSVKVAQRISCDERHDEAATQVRCQKLLTDELGIHTVVANPFLNMETATSVDRELLNQVAPQLMVASGLALRSFSSWHI